MNFFSLIGIEFKKIRRSGIWGIWLAASVILWFPAVFHADVAFARETDIGISPENNFFIQGFMGLAWFMFPASMVVGTVLLHQVERGNRGMLKMLSLPVNTAELCLAKFAVLLVFAAVQILMGVGMYYISAFIVSHTENYDFMLSPQFVFREAGYFFVAAIPMLALFWMMSVCIREPVFSIGIGLASIVPSVLMINTRFWFVYPMAYPFYVVTNEYSKLAESMTPNEINFVLWGIASVGIIILCLSVSCSCFGRAERKDGELPLLR